MNQQIFLVALLLTGLWPVLATDCPFGETNCTSTCGQFTDENSDGICDLSGPSPEERGFEELCADGQPARQRGPRDYLLIPVALITAIVYGFSSILVKRKKLTLLHHRQIWNTFLLLSFLISGLLGLLLVVQLNFGWNQTLPFDILFWHVEAGIVMFIISIFHILWHWNYYKCILPKSDKKCETETGDKKTRKSTKP